ncbi:cytochrome b560 subunit of succinate dehydrogenase [Ramicandelaber brevisporus]|nr:cytochrome b560 subunit of succinate dehydrogenase [Ramicandelaber brevisporus]
MRPNSPDLSIYQPQLTWYMSSAHRITGVAAAGGLYLGSIAYLLAPYLSAKGGFDSASVVTALSTVPAGVKVAGKATLSWLVTYHMFNGMRHLLWDTGRALTMRGVYATGYAVLGSSAVTALILALI